MGYVTRGHLAVEEYFHKKLQHCKWLIKMYCYFQLFFGIDISVGRFDRQSWALARIAEELLRRVSTSPWLRKDNALSTAFGSFA